MIETALFGIIALVSFGLNDYWGPLVSRKIGAFETSMLSRFFAVVVFFAIFLLLFFQVPSISGYVIALLLATATVELIGTVAFYKGAKMGQIAIITPIANTSSIVTVALGLIFLSFPLTSLEYVSMGMIILGTLLATFKLKDIKKLKLNRLAVGAELGFLAMACWGTGLFLQILLVEQIGWFLPGLLVSVVMLIYFAIYYKASKVKYVAPKSEWLVLFLVGLTVVVGLLAYNFGVTGTDPLIVAPILAAAPALTVVLALVRLKEKIDPNNMFGIALIVLGLVMLAL